MLPPNTVPITAEELLSLKNKGIDLIVYYRFCNEWVVNHLRAYPFGLPEFTRIPAHDYRHYFGEVVDLGKYKNGCYVKYLGELCSIQPLFSQENKYNLSIIGIYPRKLSMDECKQHIIEHFTAIVNKDLPHLNLKFIFS